jgi:hypothetical protein
MGFGAKLSFWSGKGRGSFRLRAVAWVALARTEGATKKYWRARGRSCALKNGGAKGKSTATVTTKPGRKEIPLRRISATLA